MTMTVESVTAKTGATDVPAGKIVLSVNNKASAENIKTLTDLKAGDTVTITTAAATGQWRQAKYITSGYKKLIENGQVVSGLDSSGAPRTAIGLKDDGTAIFYTIDGRQSGYSVGASESLLAQRLLAAGLHHRRMPGRRRLHHADRHPSQRHFFQPNQPTFRRQ